ncbi:histidinol-phosphate transaminase [Xylanimonas oleitrophica]|uniref:Histidinol-phosphate aminotransferase n=1 Tax=Xylanimonas oleitrophica TaxID=2607479 RepID=A0A2W5WVG5_9MICO|nr:histidinol-phosphate transaminase [Xylanimonas oleitrophica]PZR55459.1 histidinol-phosphate transaminase [Xylanimonas oleitrophica]
MTTQPAPARQPAAGLPLRPELAHEEPYGAPQLDVPVLLNVNENPYAPSEDVVATIAAEVAAAARGLNRYPDRDFLALRADLAGYLGRESGVALEAEQLWAANGSNEVMLHLLQAFGGPGRTAVSFAPTYSMYPEYARDTHTRWVTGRRAADFTVDVDAAVAVIEAEQPAVILLASPNNPTGTALPLDTVRAVLDAAARVQVPQAPAGQRGAVVVVDEAYAEFRREGTPSALELLADHPHLAVTRTMSKAFSAAGLRLGYLAASRELVDALRVVRLPYHLSAVTQAAARGALQHTGSLLAQVDALRAERDELVTWLRAQTGPSGARLVVADTDANFALFGTFADRHAVWQGLLDRGVLVREVGPDGWLRVSVGTPAETARFKEALLEVMGDLA